MSNYYPLKDLNSVYDINEHSANELLYRVLEGIKFLDLNKTDLYGDHKGSWQGLEKPTLSEEGAHAQVEKNMQDIENININLNELNSALTQLFNVTGYRTPMDYGATGDGVTDDSNYILDAIKGCANDKKVLIIDKTYFIDKHIVYDAWTGLTIIGTKGNINTLVTDIEVVTSNLKFSANGSLEINKMGSVSFYGVGFSGSNKGTGTGLILKSFHNKIFNCGFSNFNIGISLEAGAKNWLGENQILYSGFHNCTYAYKSVAGSDGDFIGNLINGRCDYGFYGSCAGFKITNNHFWATKGNLFEGFNTNISHNYFQELSDPVTNGTCATLAGSYGFNFNNNNFELISADPRSEKCALLGIKTRNGGGNISLIGNTIHGKSPATVVNLALIEMLPADNGTVYDMPIFFASNSTRCASAIFKNSYPTYNIKGNISYGSLGITVSGGTLVTEKTEVLNGMAIIYAKLTGTGTNGVFNYSALARLRNFTGIPTMVILKQVKTSGTETRLVAVTEASGQIEQTNYGEVKEVEIFATYPIAHSGDQLYSLPNV